MKLNAPVDALKATASSGPLSSCSCNPATPLRASLTLPVIVGLEPMAKPEFGAVSLIDGARVSSVKEASATVEFPAASVAVKAKVCAPSADPSSGSVVV